MEFASHFDTRQILTHAYDHRFRPFGCFLYCGSNGAIATIIIRCVTLKLARRFFSSPHLLLTSPPMSTISDDGSQQQIVSNRQNDAFMNLNVKRTPIARLGVACALSLSVALPALELLSVPVALPTIASVLHSQPNYAWVGCAYGLAALGFLPFVTAIVDIWSRRTALVVCIALFVLGSGISGGASNMAMMIAGRTLQGFGGGSIHSLASSIVKDSVITREERRLYSGLLMM